MPRRRLGPRPRSLSALAWYSSHNDALGPRWLYCRLAEHETQTKRATGRKALRAGELAEHRQRARQFAAGIVRDAIDRMPGIDLDDDTEEHLIDAAIVACYGRAAVEREGYGRRDISAMAVIEEPPRLTSQLALLTRGLRAIGL